MSDDITTPKRTTHDWYNAKYDNCGCGRWAAIADGQCSQCHEADHWDSVEAAYVKEIIRLRIETERLRAALHDAIRRPLGVVPDSALDFIEDKDNG